MTDGKIGVLTHPHDETLLQNRCFMYHVIGGGTGEWRVPVGGMQALVQALLDRCRQHGVEFITHARAESIQAGEPATVELQYQDRSVSVSAENLLINASPKSFHRLLGTEWVPQPSDEGCAVKINMLLSRLPRLKAQNIGSREAFAGSFHIDEGYEQMLASYRSAVECRIPDPAPGEIYCHSLTDPSILSPQLQASGFQTLTLFGLDMPYRLFEADHDERRMIVQNLYLQGLDRICDEPFSDCLALDREGKPCIEIRTPQDLESEVGLDLGNIFHNTLSWFYAKSAEQAGCWGVETDYPNIYLAGSSAHRGGAVSGIPGHNAAKAILEKRKTASEIRDSRCR
jgi:phytoene dehydrogenase-like protein